ncbi:tripartite motif-containing protein 45 isoform X2 [Cephus cinctus]|uniref:Tripartite motif-containing protein 45 isoform X2 n=1 Tax=Cephus cinctus TaxID=211228 RepID=A0AAJ7BP55_CEPCN|nr:tripartite motif-containing protein 45 isoform X2 [Cephus cinctus]
MRAKQQPPIDLIDLVKSSKIESLTRCCGRTTGMDSESSREAGSRVSKETFIFGSWKRRSKRRAAVTVAVRPVSMDNDETERNNNRSKALPQSQRSSTYYPSSCTSSFNPECQIHDMTDPLGDEKRDERLIQEQEDDYDEVDDDFWCPRCARKMQEPRLLPCLHPICTPCVEELLDRASCASRGTDAKNNRPGQLSGYREGCTMCDHPILSPGASVPPPHYPLQHRLVMDAVRRRLAHRVLCCDVCPEEVQASVHCPRCLRNFCSDCGTEHQEQELGVGLEMAHEVRPLWEAKRIRRTALCLTHPSHALRFHCIACQQVTCRECMWRGSHRGHASEGASGAGRRAATLMTAALQRARTLLNSLLTEYNEHVFDNSDGQDRPRSAYEFENGRCTEAHELKVFHSRSRSTMSSHRKQARERIQEFARLQRARYLLDAISLGEELLADGSEVEILSLSRIVLRRLKTLGVKPILSERNEVIDSSKTILKTVHTGVYHCCTFCSSGGRKEATCACGGRMPGGYKGCGHGHPGHPGANHWSCCGSTQWQSCCLVPRKCTYQLLL